jgi:hypothetical protein
MADEVDKAAKRAIGALFAPIGLATQRLFSIPVLIVIVVLLLATIALALPPFREPVASYVFHVHCLLNETKELGKEYSDFAIVSLQLLVALLVGGILITDQIARFAEVTALSYQQSRELHLGERQRRLTRRIYRNYLELKQAGIKITVWNAPERVLRIAFGLQRTAILAGATIPNFYLKMLMFRIATAFPKGLYGVLALIVFEGLLLAQISKTYFDYLPSCS